MKLIKNTGLWAALGLSVIMITSCEKKEEDETKTTKTSTVNIEFEHTFNDAEFALNKQYTNPFGEQVSFSSVRYYISNIKFESTDGTIWAETESYHLLDLSDPGSLVLSVDKVPSGDYHAITYTIGVDSTRNVSGAQEGALDVKNNMFWTWNTGYIFAKFEGVSPQAANNSFAYHIGGFSGENNAITSNTLHSHDHMIKVSPDASPELHIMVEMSHLFDGMHDIKVADLSGIHMPGMMAVHMAHNFSTCFSLDHIHD